MADTGIPIPDAYNVGILKVESLIWSDRPDIVAAGRFVCYRPADGSKITTIDAYLQTDGGIEYWEDDGPTSVDLRDGDYSGRPHDDWRDAIEPLFAAALAKSLTEKKS